MVEALKKGSALTFLAANSWRMEWKRLFTLASSMLRIGLIGFGGGNALIPVIEAEVVRDKKLVTTAEYQEDIVAASITPGALPVEIAAGTGQRVAGALGMILAASMMALPGAALMVGILAFLSGDSVGAMTFIRYISIPIGAFIMSLLFLYTVKTLRAEHAVTGGSWKMAAVITLTVFLLTGEADVYRLIGFGFVPFFGLSTLAVLGLSFFLILFLVNSRSKTRLAVAGMIFVLYVLSEGKSGILGGTWLAEILPILMAVLAGRAFFHSFGKSCIAPGTGRRFLAGALKELAAWLIFFSLTVVPALGVFPELASFIGRGYFSSLISFGGGDAFLTIADGLFVATGLFPAAAFFGLVVPLANVLPGSILCKILTGIGFLMGTAAGGPAMGLLAACAGFGVSVSGSGFVFGLVARLIRTFREVPAFRAISRWVRPIIGGLLIKVALALFLANLNLAKGLILPRFAAEMVTVLVVLTSLYLLLIRRADTVNPMLLAASVGILMAALL